jgi:hypothetical protein
MSRATLKNSLSERFASYSPSTPNRPMAAPKSVLTVKKARFLSLLAEKQGVGSLTKAFYFALFHVLVVFPAWTLLRASVFRNFGACPKNRTEKPTIGFLIFRNGDIIGP